jgi:FkbM family methyltransferase
VDTHVEVVLPGGLPPLSITGSTDDFGVIGAIERADGHYEPHVMQVLSDLVHPTDVCIDIGANVGVLTLLLARLAPDGHVYAFEPGDTSFGYLSRNIADAHAGNVDAAQLGVYDTTGTLTLQVSPGHPGGAYISQTDVHERASESIPVTRLDDWVDDHDLAQVDVIKLDIEGAELRVLEGASKTLERFRPVLVVECNPVALERFQNASASVLVETLRSVYGRVFFIAGTALREITSDEQIERELRRSGIVDLVCGARAELMVDRAPRPSVQQLARALMPRARHVASRVLKRERRAPLAVNFVHSPSYTARFDVNRLVATNTTTIELPVVVHNTGVDWFSSTFPNHPVCASYRWKRPDGELVEADGIRTFFREPLGPGEQTELRLLVAIPDAPGEYVLEFALVQESFAWFDDLRADLTVSLPVTVR